MNQIFDSTDESTDWSSTSCGRSTAGLSIAYMVHIRFVQCPLLIRQSPVVDRSLSVTCPLQMRYLHVPRRPPSPSRRLSSPDEHQIIIFCIFAVRSASVPLNSTITVYLRNVTLQIRSRSPKYYQLYILPE